MMMLSAFVLPPLVAARSLDMFFKGMCAWALASLEPFPKRVKFQVSTKHPRDMEVPEV